MKSLLKSVFTTLHVTSSVAKFLFLATMGIAVVTAKLKYDYAEVSHRTVLLTDYLASALYGLVALLFGWLGFTKRGKTVLAGDDQCRAEESSLLKRLPKVLVASLGIAGGVWLVLIVLFLVFGGPEFVVRLFEPWVIPVLIAISFPIAYE